MASLTPLSELIPGYPEDEPQTGSQLFQADYSELGDVARMLRRHLVDAVHGADRVPLATPLDAKKMLSDGHLMTLARKWVVYALDEERKRILVPSGHGQSMCWSRVVARKVPSPERLLKEAPVPDGGGYLAIYGGGPQILSVHDAQGGGVAEDLVTLQQGAPMFDVLFWHLESGQPAALYSLAIGLGDRGQQAVDFPDSHYLQKARGEL